MKKLLLLPFAALALTACVITVRDEPTPPANRATVTPDNSGGRAVVTPDPKPGTVTVSGGIRITIGIRVAEVITDFQPTRGEGATYRVGEQGVQFRVNTTRSGYVTLAFYNPNDPSCRSPNYVEITNIPVEAGTNIVPRNTNLSASAPAGTTFVRAYFHTSAGPSGVFQDCYNQSGFNGRTRSYLGNYPENARDVAETYLVVR